MDWANRLIGPSVGTRSRTQRWAKICRIQSQGSGHGVHFARSKPVETGNRGLSMPSAETSRDEPLAPIAMDGNFVADPNGNGTSDSPEERIHGRIAHSSPAMQIVLPFTANGWKSEQSISHSDVAAN